MPFIPKEELNLVNNIVSEPHFPSASLGMCGSLYTCMKLLDHIPSWLKNKYIVTVLVFSVWLLFFDDRDIITTHFKYNRELRQLEQSRDYYLQQIEATKKELDDFKQNPAMLEKYAREKYWMKKDNEDLFILPE